MVIVSFKYATASRYWLSTAVPRAPQPRSCAFTSIRETDNTRISNWLPALSYVTS
jgi:hypothetical protein